MVTTTCFPPSASARRFSSFRSPYLPTYAERKATEPSHRESGCNIMVERNGATDDSTSQRKKIAVACGRCRKRKIRCSGDAGNGQPCINCKNAGVEPCQFLRVSSQEVAHVKANGAFSYNIDVSRFIQARGSTAAPQTSMSVHTFSNGMGLGDSHTMSGRRLGVGMGVGAAIGGAPRGGLEGGGVGGMGGALAHDAYGNKSYYSSSGWSNGYAESSGVEYGICPPSFQAVADSPYEASAYLMASSQATAPSKPTGLVYLDAEAAYGYGSMSVTGVRQAASSGGETATACLPFISRSLPSSSERLPTAAMTGFRLASSSSTSPKSTAAVYRTGGDYKNNAKQGGTMDSSSAAATAPEGFHSYENSQLAFSSHQHQHSNALLGPPGRSGDQQTFVAPPASDGLLTAAGGDASLRTSVSGSEASYTLSEPAGPSSISSSSLSSSSSSSLTTAVFHHPQQQQQRGQASPPQPLLPPPSGSQVRLWFQQRRQPLVYVLPP